MMIKLTPLDDTIAAISTPIGEGGISIVRLSGKDAILIADGIFDAKSKRRLSKAKSHSIIYGHIIDNARSHIIDEVLVMLMKGPLTYTKEDIVEINCHGGIVAARAILELCMNKGARLAEPGEFTKRAFLSGRIDLAQAEAVLDIIKSKTDLSLKYSMGQLDGHLSNKIKELKEGLVKILAGLEAEIDFPEDEIQGVLSADLSDRLRGISNRLKSLLDTSQYGAILRDGAKAVICGRPNVGKSSLFNALLKQDRAIVTPISGTTRDTIEEVVNIRGIPIRVVDTAGIAETDNVIESEGINRTKLALNGADICLCVLDCSRPIEREDEAILNETKAQNRIIVLNKIDLVSNDTQTLNRNKYNNGSPCINVSCLTYEGIPLLEDAIYNTMWDGGVNRSDEVVITNLRHREALRGAKDSIEQAIDALKEGLAPEFISADIREALDALGKIAGETVTEDILEQIFSQFCIGK